MKTKLLLSFLFSLLTFQVIYSNGVAIVSNGIYLQLKTSDVNVEVNNQIAVVTTRQTFYNQTGEKTPIKYAFPLHAKANAIEMKWYVNGIWYKAAISKNAQNDTIPGEPGGQIDHNLVEYLGENALFFTIRDSVDIDSSVIFELKYVELLPYSFGEVSFFYPNDYTRIQWDDNVDRQQLTFHLQSDRTIEVVELEELNGDVQVGAHEATVGFELYERPANSDYRITYQLSSTELGVYSMSTFIPDSLLYCDDYGQGFVSLIIEPESNANTEVIEKNFSLIIDRSGSMSGNKIVQAKNAASFIVNNLNFGDNFNIVDFSSNVSSLFNEMAPYTLHNKTLALNYINSISANGSTNISSALTTSIQQFSTSDPAKANIIIFFTDGMATAGVTTTTGILDAVETVVNASETEIFLFTFGIGTDVDKQLLTLLALENNGLSSFLGNDELEEKITSFFLTINNPVLLNTQFEFTPDIITNVYPEPLPNLYKGQQLILSGRYQEADIVNLRLTGKAFNLPVEYNFQISLADSSDVEKSFLPKIWAKQAIDKLTIDHNLAESNEEAELIKSVIDSLSVCFGVISTQFTSFEDNGDITSTEFDELSRYTTFDLHVGPNPFSREIIIRLTSKTERFDPVTISLVNSLGKVLYVTHDQLKGLSTDIVIDDLEFLVPGFYYVMITIGDEVIVRKIVKE